MVDLEILRWREITIFSFSHRYFTSLSSGDTEKAIRKLPWKSIEVAVGENKKTTKLSTFYQNFACVRHEVISDFFALLRGSTSQGLFQAGLFCPMGLWGDSPFCSRIWTKIQVVNYDEPLSGPLTPPLGSWSKSTEGHRSVLVFSTLLSFGPFCYKSISQSIQVFFGKRLIC